MVHSQFGATFSDFAAYLSSVCADLRQAFEAAEDSLVDISASHMDVDLSDVTAVPWSQTNAGDSDKFVGDIPPSVPVDRREMAIRNFIAWSDERYVKV